MRFDRLTPADLEGALRLSTQAGWNQLPEDWTRVLDLGRDSCIAGREDGRLIATSSVVTYAGRCGWIGMVLVDESQRGKGLGTELLRRTVERAKQLKLEAFGLDATPLGRPVYLKLGFVDVAPIDRWGGVLRATGAPKDVSALNPSTLESLAAWDQERCGEDRSALLRHLVEEPGTIGVTVHSGRRLRGFAFLRPGRQHAHLGPIVAEEPAVLDALLNGAAREAKGGSLFVDALQTAEHTAALSAHGLNVQRKLTRMTHGRPENRLMGPGVVAATAFEWG